MSSFVSADQMAWHLLEARIYVQNNCLGHLGKGFGHMEGFSETQWKELKMWIVIGVPALVIDKTS